MRAASLSLILAAMIAHAPAALAENITLRDTQNGQAISLATGDVLTLKLGGQRGQGFWRLDSDLNPELSLAGRSTESVLLPDAPEVTVFTFSARNSGTVAIRASYVTSGADQTPIKTFAAMVTVAAE